MSVCPVDFKPCMDDMCHNAGCLRTRHGEQMLDRCAWCGSVDALSPGSGFCVSCAIDGEDDAMAGDDEDEDFFS